MNVLQTQQQFYIPPIQTQNVFNNNSLQQEYRGQTFCQKQEEQQLQPTLQNQYQQVPSPLTRQQQVSCLQQQMPFPLQQMPIQQQQQQQDFDQNDWYCNLEEIWQDMSSNCDRTFREQNKKLHLILQAAKSLDRNNIFFTQSNQQNSKFQTDTQECSPFSKKVCKTLGQGSRSIYNNNDDFNSGVYNCILDKNINKEYDSFMHNNFSLDISSNPVNYADMNNNKNMTLSDIHNDYSYNTNTNLSTSNMTRGNKRSSEKNNISSDYNGISGNQNMDMMNEKCLLLSSQKTCGATVIFRSKRKTRRKNGGTLVWSDLPYTFDDLVNMPVEQFNNICSKLDEIRQFNAKYIRRRGKNKVAARNCRIRKMSSMKKLDNRINGLEDRRQSLEKERDQLTQEVTTLHERTEWLYRYIFERLRDKKGEPYKEENHSLKLATDGNIYLVPNRKI